MIVPMKKATILFPEGEAAAAVASLRSLGVMHVEHQNPPEGRNIPGIREKVNLINAALDIMEQAMVSGQEIPPQETVGGDWTATAAHITDLGKQREQLEALTRSITSQINKWVPWGDIDLGQVRQLREKGIRLALYQVPQKELGSFPDDVVVRKIFSAGDIVYCVAVSRREFDTAFPEIIPPEEGLSTLKGRLTKTAAAIGEVQAAITRCARYHDELVSIRKRLVKEIEFQQVLAGMGKESAVGYVTGYIPFDVEQALIGEAKGRKWGILITDPSDGDNVPTLLRNPAWIDRIKPVFNLLGLTPGYRELDVSMLFLVFLSIFFGILIGDAGYGLVYILITFVLQKKMKETPELKTTFSLFYVLGLSAVIWGVMTGTFFGQTWLRDLGVQPLVPPLNDPNTMTTFCFFLGALHLSIAHAWRAALKYPSLTVLADCGYICILWGAFYLAKTLILGDAFPPLGIWLFAGGILLVILFTNPQRNMLRAIGEGLGTIALSLMNNITDVISYIRLFAVGLAGLAIAETTNTLASGFGEGIMAVIAGAAIILIGHGLNIILGPMSVLVHGVRLNVLEFSGHANVTWSGYTFEPLKE
jgi:V/A-type H+-transporting ATPase subunit I